MHTRRHALDNGLLVADLAGKGVVCPAVEGRLGGGVEGLAVGSQVEAVVESAAGDEHGGAVDAAVGAEGVDGHASSVLLDEHVAFCVPDDGSYLFQAAGNLHDGPAGVDGVLVTHVGDAAAALGERELRNYGMDIWGRVSCLSGRRRRGSNLPAPKRAAATVKRLNKRILLGSRAASRGEEETLQPEGRENRKPGKRGGHDTSFYTIGFGNKTRSRARQGGSSFVLHLNDR